MTVVLLLVAAAALAVAGLAVVAATRAGRARRRAEGLARDAAARAGAAEDRRVAAFGALPMAALDVVGGARLADANARAMAWFPHLRAGMTMLEAFGEHRLAEEVADAVTRGESRTFEVRLFAEGRRTYRVLVAPLAGDAGGEAIVFMSDLTEAVAYQELRSQFVANVSHELRTPLTGLRGLVEALDDPEMDRATHVRFVARASAEIQRLEALIADILFLSELESTPGMPAGERSDLAAAAAHGIEMLEAEAAGQRVRMEARLTGPVWTPLTEAMAVTVVRNLLENAVRYAGPGARVTVTVEDSDGGPGHVDLVVSDDGVGIPERHLPHVFERFYRADPSRSKRMGGTGLGLSIVKHIAERCGGSAHATSREGFGTSVRVRLPRADDPDAVAGPEEAVTGAEGAVDAR